LSFGSSFVDELRVGGEDANEKEIDGKEIFSVSKKEIIEIIWD